MGFIEAHDYCFTFVVPLGNSGVPLPFLLYKYQVICSFTSCFNYVSLDVLSVIQVLK